MCVIQCHYRAKNAERYEHACLKQINSAATINQRWHKRLSLGKKERELLEAGCCDVAGTLEGVGCETQTKEQGSEGGEDESRETKFFCTEVKQSARETATHHQPAAQEQVAIYQQLQRY